MMMLPTCVSRDVVQDDESFKLVLKAAQAARRQWLGRKLPQPKLCIFVALNK